MSFLSRLLGTEPDPREEVRALWYKCVEIAREPEWYSECGVADTLDGRFDMVSAVLAMVMLRMEGDSQLAPRTGLLAEFFVEDMDGQLRQSGVGDLMVGKKIGKLMSTLGGRISAYRDGFAQSENAVIGAVAEAVSRNVELRESAEGERVARRLNALRSRLAETTSDAVLAGDIG